MTEVTGRRRSFGGLASSGAAVVCVGGLIAWAVSVNDPYRRLTATPTIPAPAYESAEDLEAVLAAITLERANGDSGAVKPLVVANPEPERAAAAPMPLLVSPRAEMPVRAGPAELLPEPRGSAGAAPPGIPAEDFGAGNGPRTAAPLPPVPPLADDAAPLGGILAAHGPGLDPVVPPRTPAPLRIAATPESEGALGLARTDRVEVQRRLALAGFDPRGFDGFLGPNSRRAIADFQAAWGFPATGYLNPVVYADLQERTEEAYQALRRRAAAAPSAAPKLAPPARERALASADDKGCSRGSQGAIVPRQGFLCDLIGLGEKLTSVGRNRLDHETPVAAGERRAVIVGGGER